MSSHVGVVFHVTAGEGDPYNEFANPANQVSSHFGIGNGQGGMADGLIEQYVDTANTAWAECAGNASYVSVETEGEPTDPLTPAQVASFARLYQWIAQTHNIPYVITDTPGQPGFITHGDGGTAWGGHTDCPGPQRSAQRQTILNQAQPTPGATTVSQVMKISPASNMPVFARRTSDNALYLDWLDTNAQPHGPLGIGAGGTVMEDDISLEFDKNNLIHLSHTGPSGTPYYYWQSADAKFHGPLGLG